MPILLLCVDFGSQYYQQPQNQPLDPDVFEQTINTNYDVSAPAGLPTNLEFYQVK